jgi:truncated hemoglobin YjbI
MQFSGRIRRVADGAVHVALDEAERDLLSQVASEVRDFLDESPQDPALRRLFPVAHDDPEREREYRELTRQQLVSGRERALGVLVETVDNQILSPEEADAWVRALNDARLILGTRLDVTEDYDWDALGEGTPRAQELALYAYLSWLQEQLVAAL